MAEVEDRAPERVDIVGVGSYWHVVSVQPGVAVCGSQSLGNHRPITGVLAVDFVNGKWPCAECRDIVRGNRSALWGPAS